MSKSVVLLCLTLTCVLLSACASPDLPSPCADFGAHCEKTPINSWNYSTI